MTSLVNNLQRLLALALIMVATGFSSSALAELFAAVLPSSRSVEVNDYATFYATVINAGTEDLANCRAQVANDVPVTFWYRPKGPGIGYPTDERGTPADIPAGGSQLFFLEIRSSSVLLPVEVTFDFVCDGVTPAAIVSGVNTLLFSASTARTPDLIALTATLTGDGIVNLPTDGSGAFFAAATTNLGATGNITVNAVGTGDATQAELTVCETQAATGLCTSLASPSKTLRIGMGQRNTFTVFMRSTADVPFDPARNRVSLQFADAAGEIRGSTSIAVRSADLTIRGVPKSSLLAGDTYLFTPTVGSRSNRSLVFSLENQPSWLTVSDNGVITGIPGSEDVGTYADIVLSVNDGSNTTALPPFSIEVIASNWRAGPAMPYETVRHSMATLDNQLFYFGGVRVREYNAPQNTWSVRAEMPVSLISGNSHGVDGMIYAFSGQSGIVQRYDPLLDSWSQLGEAPNRSGAASAEVDGFVYLIGGIEPNSGNPRLVREMDIYNSINNTWIVGPPPPIRCDGAAASVIGSVIYLTGGCSDSAEVHAFDTDTGTWSQTTSMPVALAYHNSAVINGKLYVFGGYRTDSAGVRAARAEAYVFDPDTAQWQESQSMRLPRAEFGAAVFNDEIWVTGGWDDDRRPSDAVEIFSPNLDP